LSFYAKALELCNKVFMPYRIKSSRDIKGYDSCISPTVEVLGPFMREEEEQQIGSRLTFSESKLSLRKEAIVF